MLLNGDPGGFVFFEADCQERVFNFSWGDVTSIETMVYGLVVILLSFLCNCDNLKLKLHQGKRCYPDERWLFIGRFKVASVPGISVALEASKKVAKSIMGIILFINKAA